VKRGVEHVDRDKVPPTTRRIYLLASAMALGGNALLLVAKGLVASRTGSSAIYADAANSASDVAYSLLMGLALWLSLKPPDASHPHGHRRIEPLVNLLIGAMMLYAAYEAARSGVEALIAGGLPDLTGLAIGVLLGTAAIKAGMYHVALSYGQRVHSPALLASARDNLADISTSATALVGYLGARYLHPAVDPVAAFLVTLWIARNAIAVLRDGLRGLIGGAAPPELTTHILEAIHSVPGVLDAHRVIVEYVGPQVYVDIHVGMDPGASLREVHHVSHELRQRVEALAEVDHAYIHVEPFDHTLEQEQNV
jgi:cation diffusion facilitator family transporter